MEFVNPEPTIRRIDTNLCPKCGAERIDSRFDITWMTNDRRVVEGSDVPGVMCQGCGALDVLTEILAEASGAANHSQLTPIQVLEGDRAWRIRVGLLPREAMDSSIVTATFVVRAVDWTAAYDPSDGGHNDR